MHPKASFVLQMSFTHHHCLAGYTPAYNRVISAPSNRPVLTSNPSANSRNFMQENKLGAGAAVVKPAKSTKVCGRVWMVNSIGRFYVKMLVVPSCVSPYTRFLVVRKRHLPYTVHVFWSYERGSCNKIAMLFSFSISITKRVQSSCEVCYYAFPFMLHMREQHQPHTCACRRMIQNTCRSRTMAVCQTIFWNAR